MKSLGLVFRNAMTCVSGRRYDSILQSVWLPIKQGGTTESIFALGNTIVLPRAFFVTLLQEERQEE